jgi:hypothetical protein
VLAVGQRVQVQQPGVQPVAVGVLGGQCRLDLVVVADLAGRGVDQEHPARLQPALGDHRRRVDLDHAGLAGQDHQVVAGAPPASRPQAVAVKHRPDHRAVGEADAGRAVPGLHQRGVEGVEVPAGRIHVAGSVLPRLRDHHQHRVRQAAPAQVQQFQHLVEGRGVRAARGADRVQPREVAIGAAEQVRGQQRLPGRHPVAVAADGVDLAVVGDQPERLGQRPGREGVGGEPAVHQRDGAGEPLVVQVGVEGRQLRRGQHSLVDQGPPGQRREVELVAGFGDPALGDLAQAEGHPLQLQAARKLAGGALRGADEHLLEGRHHLQRAGPDALGVDRHRPPTEYPQSLGGSGLGHHRLHPVTGGLAGRQERDAGGVAARCRQRDAEFGAGHRPQELVRDGDGDTGTVAALRLGPGGAAVVHVVQRRQGGADEGVARPAAEVGEAGHPAGVGFVARVVQALCGGHCGKLHARPPSVGGASALGPSAVRFGGSSWRSGWSLAGQRRPR